MTCRLGLGPLRPGIFVKSWVKEPLLKFTWQKNGTQKKNSAVKVLAKATNGYSIIAAEIQVLRRVASEAVSNPHIVHLQEVYQDDFNVYLVLDLCRGPLLSDVLSLGGPLHEPVAMKILRFSPLQILCKLYNPSSSVL